MSARRLTGGRPTRAGPMRMPVRYRGYLLWWDAALDAWIAESQHAEDAGDATYPTYCDLLAAIDATYEAPGGAS